MLPSCDEEACENEGISVKPPHEPYEALRTRIYRAIAAAGGAAATGSVIDRRGGRDICLCDGNTTQRREDGEMEYGVTELDSHRVQDLAKEDTSTRPWDIEKQEMTTATARTAPRTRHE
ncbi:unnamed protein product [Gongylonema pulchrum]|uniref:Uncharacterized protein n=1 Tax=Gongylonema pulchrum TaxID=637853 RepID=A0A183DYC7_9BILA|nr:unnamed protein product [Gongylonema pulchrum]